jgi:tetrahydromethanopterin S-methyltransferase subunit C
VFALLVERWRGRTISAALVVAIASFVVSLLVGRIAGRGLATVLPIGDRVIVSLVFATALMLGMRFAFPARETI